MSELLILMLFLLPLLAVAVARFWAFWKRRRENFYNRLCFRFILLAVRMRHRVNYLHGVPPAKKIRFTWERKEKDEEDLPLELNDA